MSLTKSRIRTFINWNPANDLYSTWLENISQNHTRNNCRLVHVFPTNLAGGLANLGRNLPTKMSTNTKKPTSTNRDDNTYETNSSAPTLQQAYEETASKWDWMFTKAHPILMIFCDYILNAPAWSAFGRKYFGHVFRQTRFWKTTC